MLFRRFAPCLAVVLLALLAFPFACARGPAPADPARDAEALATAGQLAPAIREVEVALRRRPNDVGLLRAAGTLHARAGHWSRALASLEAATREAPHDADLWLLRSGVEARRGDDDAAYVSARRALRLAPDDPRVLHVFSEAADRAGIEDEARAARARLAAALAR